jgi:phosphopantothenoylcysteine decarboxylase/phosphopantothenate--cysteine ligase
MFPRGRKLLLGVSGGISAYKSCELLRRLQDQGFIVDVVPTAASLNFVGKATWEALSGRKVITDLWTDVESVPHISMAKENDLILIAPATADLLAKLASGRADDLLTNIVLASNAPKILVPAMHPEMWLNPATSANVSILRDRGFVVIEPDQGRMTGSDVGVGRYPDLSKIFSEIQAKLQNNSDLAGRRIIVTTGGTREPIDPVRYIGNRSSGKQGFALALAAATRGANVHLISANADLPEIDGVEITKIETATELLSVLEEEFPKCDALIMSAAVADARVSNYSQNKIKKSDFETMELTKNPDILARIAEIKRSGQIVVGFAAETDSKSENLVKLGSEKLRSKSLDLMYVNNVTDGAIFGSDLTQGIIIDSNERNIEIPKISKDTLSDILLDQLVSKLG